MSAWLETINRWAEAWWPYVFHATWQAALVAALLLTVVWAKRRWSSSVRYGLLMVALLKFVLPPVLPLPIGLFGLVSAPQAPAMEMTPRSVSIAPLAGRASPDVVRYVNEPTTTPTRPVEMEPLAPVTLVPAARLTRSAWLMLAHGAGMALVGLWTLIGMIRLARLVREAAPLDRDEVAARAETIARELGLRRRIRLLISPRPITPMAFGLTRPTVMVPRALFRELSLDEQTTVLAHELVHHRRHDIWVNALQVVVAIGHWFNPLAWILNRAIRREREDCCDDALLCLQGIRKESYCDALVRSASSLAVPAPWQCTLGLAHKVHPLGQRLRRIMDPMRRPVARLSLRGALLVGLVALCLWPGVRRVTAASEEASMEPPASSAENAAGTFELRVVDRNGDSVPGAGVGGIWYLTDMSYETLQGTTDVEGVFRADWTNRPPLAFHISVLADGYALVSVRWHPDTHGPVPDTYTLTLTPATKVGGLIEDRAGQPAANAEVLFHLPGGNTSDLGEPSREYFGSIDEDFHIERTDEQGRWTCNHMPPDLKDMQVYVRHPDFGRQTFYGEKLDLEALLAGTAHFVLEEGGSLEGRVVDEAGRPVAGAIANLQRFWDKNYQQTTGEDGEFWFTHQQEPENTLIVHADGYGPWLQQVSLTSSPALTVVQLRPGAEVSGRIVDDKGQPVEGVRFGVHAWRGLSALGVVGMYTGPDGRFIWSSAPSGEPVELFFAKPEYFSVRDFVVTPPATNLTVALERAFRVQGQVTDANTGDPIAVAKAIPGYTADTTVFRWRTGRTSLIQGGTLDVFFTERAPPYSLKVEAEGYQPFVSPYWEEPTQPVELTVELRSLTAEQRRPIAGRVVLPDGSAPAARAQVGLMKSDRVGVSADGLRNGLSVQVTETDDQGRFEVPRDPDVIKVAVWCASGFAIVDVAALDESDVIRLHPFARIEGQVLTGTEPQPGLKIHAGGAERNPIKFQFTPVTDEQGRFTIEQIPAERYTLWAMTGRIGDSGTHGTPVILEPGETRHVTMGGHGWTVTGRLTTSDNNASIGVLADSLQYDANLCSDVPRLPVPEGLHSLEQLEQWYTEYARSDEGLRRFLAYRAYAVKPLPDGRFAVHDVVPGEYKLRVTLRKPTPDQSGFGETVGQLNRDVAIPELTKPLPEEPIDLGVLEVAM